MGAFGSGSETEFLSGLARVRLVFGEVGVVAAIGPEKFVF